jgi:predicted dehydrogenase
MRDKSLRREFLAGSMGLVAAAGAQEGRRIKAAMVGVGIRGTDLLGQVLAKENVQVAAICDIDPVKRDTAQSKAKRDSPRAFADYREVLGLADVDAVFIATPCDLHSEMAAAALGAGKHVYCEKPLGITPEQVQRVVDASRKSKAVFQIGQQLRYFPGVREMIRRIHQDGLIGEPYIIKAQRHSTPIRPESEAARPAWYKDVKRSGDLIVENSVHNLDVCNWVARSRPVSAYGHGKKYFPKPIPPGTEMMDGFSVEYIYENDMHLDFSQLYMHPRSLKVVPNGQWYLVFGAKGTADLTQGTVYDFDAAEGREVVAAAVREEKEDAVGDFFSCIREGRSPFAGITVAATAALTAIMGREAIYRRGMITWKELGVRL